MSNESFTLEAMIDDATIRARHVPAEALFSWRKRSVTVPDGWLALVTRRDHDAIVVTGGGRCDNDAVEQVLWVREAPLECSVHDEHLRTRDGYIGHGELRCRVRIIPELAELAAFAQTFCGTDAEVRDDTIRAHLAASLNSVLLRFVGDHDAEAMLEGLDATDVRKQVEQGLGAACLVAGLTLDGPVSFTFDSDDYQRMHQQAHRVTREKQRQDARREIQHALIRAQADHLDDVVGLLEKMKAAAESHEIVNFAELMKTFDPAERGELYAALWHLESTGARMEAVAVVAGQELIFLPCHDIEHPSGRITLPEDLGPLRSVQCDHSQQCKRTFLIGAATGAWLLDADTGQITAKLAMSLSEDQSVRGGFNAVARHDELVFATHSDRGVVRWRLEPQPECLGESWFETLTAHADAVRGARAVDDKLWFIIDDAVYASPVNASPDTPPMHYGGSDTILTALCVHDDRVYAGNVDGEILAWSIGDPESAQVIRGQADGMVESINALTTGGLTQLVIADRRRGLATVIVEDGYELRHASKDQIVRRAVAAPDVMAAMNDARDRILLWRSDRPRDPVLSANIDQLTGHRIQDLCLMPKKM